MTDDEYRLRTMEMRLRCLEMAERYSGGNPIATLDAAFAFESYVALGFDAGMRAVLSPPPLPPVPQHEKPDDADRLPTPGTHRLH